MHPVHPDWSGSYWFGVHPCSRRPGPCTSLPCRQCVPSMYMCSLSIQSFVLLAIANPGSCWFSLSTELGALTWAKSSGGVGSVPAVVPVGTPSRPFLKMRMEPHFCPLVHISPAANAVSAQSAPGGNITTRWWYAPRRRGPGRVPIGLIQGHWFSFSSSQGTVPLHATAELRDWLTQKKEVRQLQYPKL